MSKTCCATSPTRTKRKKQRKRKKKKIKVKKKKQEREKKEKIKRRKREKDLSPTFVSLQASTLPRPPALLVAMNDDDDE